MTAAKRTKKKTTARKSTSSRATAKKTAARKSGTKKTTKKKIATRKSATKKTVKKTTRKPAAKKTVKKTTSAQKTTRKSAARAPTRRTTSRGAAKPTTGSAARSATGRPAGVTLTRPKPVKRRVRPAKFDKQQLAEIRRQLENERQDLQRQLEDLEEESFQGTQSDLTGEVGLNEDFADAGSATFDRENALSIRNNITDLIDQMTRAVRRIDEGTYGTCERCGNPIDAARLKALPHALLCMDCKRREERAR